MKGVDTNVLARYLTQDDAAQCRRVDVLMAEVIEGDGQLRVDDIVLCELVWVLRGAYRFDRATIASAIEKVLGTGLFAFDDRDVLRHALDEYRDAGGDFADYVIGARNRKAGCETTITFDRALASSPAFAVL